MNNITPFNVNLYAALGCDLLWIRPEGTLGGFIPQTISLDLHGYKFLLVIHNHAKGHLTTLLLNDPTIPYIQTVDGGLQKFRVVTISEDGVAFSGVYTGTISDDTLTTNSVSAAMPYHIYGIR